MTIPVICVLSSKIVLDALSVSKIKLKKCRGDFMIEVFMQYLSIPSRINFLQLGQYSLFGEQRFRGQFEQGFAFFSFNKALSMHWIGKRNAVTFDPSFFHKSGKKILGIGYFWPSCDGRALRGLENSFSMATYKMLFHNTLLLSRFSRLSLLTQTQSKIVNMSMNYCVSALWPLKYRCFLNELLIYITINNYEKTGRD